MITGGSGSGKTNALLNLIKEQDDVDKLYFNAKDLSKPKYEFLIKTCQDTGTKHFSDPNLCVQIQWMTFIRILMITTQDERAKI